MILDSTYQLQWLTSFLISQGCQKSKADNCIFSLFLSIQTSLCKQGVTENKEIEAYTNIHTGGWTNVRVPNGEVEQCGGYLASFITALYSWKQGINGIHKQSYRKGWTDITVLNGALKQCGVYSTSLRTFMSSYILPEEGKHLSEQDTQAKLRRKYFWYGMTFDVMSHIMGCCMKEALSAVPVPHRNPVIQERVDKFRSYYKKRVSLTAVAWNSNVATCFGHLYC